MSKIYLVNRTDYRGTKPIKVFILKESAKFFKGECDIALKLIFQSENPEEEFLLLKQFDSDAIFTHTINYEVEEIQSE